MLDWEFTDETEKWPDDIDSVAVDEPPAARWQPTRRFWLLLSVACIAVLIAGIGVLAWRIYERRQAMREDLTTLIYEEDQARFAGLIEEADTFLAPDVPAEWEERYRQTFVPRSPDSVDVESISFENESALVRITLDSHRQIRSYHLVERQWRRAPVPAEQWNPEEQTLDAGDTTIAYSRYDSEFAQTLAARLPALLDAVAAWRYHPSLTLIRIVSSDLHAPIVAATDNTVEVNSPYLVPYNGVLSGPATVRLALAEELILQVSSIMPQGLRTQDSLPSGGRFLEAARTVAAMYAALTPDERAQMRSVWQESLAGTWTSPFYSPLTENVEPLAPAPADAAMLLTVDYIYQHHGSDTLHDIVQRPAAINSWDRVFEHALGMQTLELEDAAAASAGIESMPTSLAATRTAPPTTATILDIGRSLRRRLHIQPAGTENQLIADVTPTHVRFTPNDLRLELGCVGAGSAIQIEGEWLEAGRRLRATDVSVSHLALPNVFTLHEPPTNTIAYLLDKPESLKLVALGDDGTRTPILELDDDVSVVEAITPLYAEDGRSVQFMINLRTSSCNRQLTYVYAPGAGITHAWVMHQTIREPIWRPEREDFLIVRGVSARIGHYGVFNVSQDDDVIQLNSFLRPYAWSPVTQRLLVEDVRGRQEERSALGLIDPSTGDLHRLNLAGRQRGIADYHLTQNGRWLAYLTGDSGGSPAPNRLNLRQLDYYLNAIPIGLRANDGLRLKTQRYAPGNEIVLWAGSVRTGQLVPTRLLVLDPEQLTDPIVLDTRTDSPLTASIVCPNGRILYTVTHDVGTTLLERRLSEAESRVLLEDATNLEPIACPPPM